MHSRKHTHAPTPLPTPRRPPPPAEKKLEGTHLLGGGDVRFLHDFHEQRRRPSRDLATTTTCPDDGEIEISISLRTDNYGYETSWTVRGPGGPDGDVVARGPPPGTNYDDSRSYVGGWCVPSPGAYEVVVEDGAGDGMCAGGGAYGCGSFKVYLDGRVAGMVVQDGAAWSSRTITVNAVDPWAVGGGSSSSGRSGGYCDKVGNAMRNVGDGTCTLPSGGRGHRVRVRTKVDEYGEETSWAIRNGGGTVVMRMGPIIPSNSARAVEDCLPPGEYVFKISDFDGICCKHGEGRYALVVDGTELLGGGQFAASESHTFRLGHDWTAGMSDRACEWWWGHHVRRQDWHTRCYAEYCDRDYRHLRWSESLEADARDYAERLLDTCSETGIQHDHTNDDYGENLSKNQGEGTWGDLYTAERQMGRFVDNEEFWGWHDNAHLTQAIWYASRYLGCADSARDMGDGVTCRMQVCRYAKAGNCQMDSFSSSVGNNWRTPMMADDSLCGPVCPPGGCHL